MIRIKRITNLERLAETIPKPKGAVPKFGLPGWKMISLDQKIPMIPGPKGAYSFTRRKVGKRLWGAKLEFDLSDPYCHETKFSYEPLHDKNLLEFFSRPINRKHLLRADLITDHMDVKCSLRDYNAYRKYLRQVHVGRIKEELKRRNRLFVESRALRFAENQARKEAERLKEREKVAPERQRFVQKRLLQEELKIYKLKERACRTTRRLKLLRLIKREEQRLINIKREKRIEQIRQKCKIATKIAHRKTIDMLMDWKKKEKARKKGKEKRLIAQQKQKDMEERIKAEYNIQKIKSALEKISNFRWRRKQQFQEKDIAKQKVLLQRIDARRKKFIEDYNNKINKQAAKMKRLLDDVKLFTNCYMKRRLADGKKVICCKNLKTDMDGKKNEVKNNSPNLANLPLKFMKQKKRKISTSDKRWNVMQKSKQIT